MMPSQTGSTPGILSSTGATIGTTTKMISKASMTKPSRNSAAMTASVAPATPPGRLVSARSTMVSPPRPRNTRLNKVAPIRITKIMLVICVVRTITGISRPVAPDRSAASRIAPTAPTDAASVGVATPPRIEPSTARISAIGAIRTAISRRASAKPRGASGSGAIAGDFFGKKIAMPIR